MWPKPEQTREVEARLGGFNDMPPNWVEISESEYYWRWNIKPARSIYQFRQVPGLSTCVSLFVHPGDYSGIGFWTDYDGKATRVEIDAYKPRYFKWKVCEHEAVVTRSGNCYHEYQCKKCGYEWAVDSSG